MEQQWNRGKLDNSKAKPKLREKSVYKTGEYIRMALSENVNVSMSAVKWARASAAIKVVADATRKKGNKNTKTNDAEILDDISNNITEQIHKSLSGEAIYEKLRMILDSDNNNDGQK